MGRVDLDNVTTNTIYEFETSHSPKHRKEMNEKYIQNGVKVIVINIKKLLDDIFQRYLSQRSILYLIEKYQ